MQSSIGKTVRFLTVLGMSRTRIDPLKTTSFVNELLKLMGTEI